jgi:hypothetical protein
VPDEMKPEPAVVFEGQTSDWSEHASMLSNSEANALADDTAVEQARAIGFTEEEVSLIHTQEAVLPVDQSVDVARSVKRSSERRSIGRIAERIVANELEFHGFLVRDLNLEGLAANVDLLAVKEGKVWQVQVKGARFDSNYVDGWWFHYGYCKPEHIVNSEEPMFNKAVSAFRADVVVLVCVKSPHEYQCIVLPIEKAEEAAQINLNYAYRTKKKDGSGKRPNVVWVANYLPKTSQEKAEAMQREIDLIRRYMGKWDFDSSLSPSTFLNTASD